VAHLHGRADHQHAPGACELIAAPLARPPPPSTPPSTAVATILPAAPPARVAVPSAIAPYRLAPKTSPPARA
jgi:hypothetical protein